MQKQLLHGENIKKISSPEELNNYIQVSRPGIWLLLAAVAAVLAGLLVWGATGSLPTTVTANAVAMEGRLVCYLSQEQAAAVTPGAYAAGAGGSGQVETLSPAPLSYDEAAEQLAGDYARSALDLGPWNVRLNIAVDTLLTEGAVYPVSITTSDVRPFDFLLGRGGR